MFSLLRWLCDREVVDICENSASQVSRQPSLRVSECGAHTHPLPRLLLLVFILSSSVWSHKLVYTSIKCLEKKVISTNFEKVPKMLSGPFLKFCVKLYQIHIFFCFFVLFQCRQRKKHTYSKKYFWNKNPGVPTLWAVTRL